MISELPFKSSLPELGKIIDGMINAGEKVLEVYETDFSTEKKDDDSPITQADIESNKILKEVLGKTGITILSEEDVDDKKRLSDDKIWIIDPLDGTTDFDTLDGVWTQNQAFRVVVIPADNVGRVDYSDFDAVVERYNIESFPRR